MTFLKNNKVDFKYIALAALAVIFTWVLHEFAHWTAGNFLGYEMGMTLNKAFPVSGKYNSDVHFQIISAAGPLITLAEALIVFFIMLNASRKVLYSFLFTCFYMRLLAMGLSFINPNDEARVSQSLGIGNFTLPVIMVTVLFCLLYKISGLYRFSKKFIAINLGLVLFFTSVIILADQFLKWRLI